MNVKRNKLVYLTSKKLYNVFFHLSRKHEIMELIHNKMLCKDHGAF